MSFQFLIRKDPQPDAKYFSSYKSNKVDKTSFDHCITLRSFLLQWDRLSRAMEDVFASNASIVAWNLCEGECRRRPM
jgi:hypothetical protein